MRMIGLFSAALAMAAFVTSPVIVQARGTGAEMQKTKKGPVGKMTKKKRIDTGIGADGPLGGNPGGPVMPEFGPKKPK